VADVPQDEERAEGAGRAPAGTPPVPLPEGSPVGVGGGRTPRRPVKAAGGLNAECSLLRVYRLEGMNELSGIVGGVRHYRYPRIPTPGQGQVAGRGEGGGEHGGGGGGGGGGRGRRGRTQTVAHVLLDESHTEGTDLFCWVLVGDCFSWVFGSAHRRVERSFRRHHFVNNS